MTGYTYSISVARCTYVKDKVGRYLVNFGISQFWLLGSMKMIIRITGIFISGPFLVKLFEKIEAVPGLVMFEIVL